MDRKTHLYEVISKTCDYDEIIVKNKKITCKNMKFAKMYCNIFIIC